MALASISCTRVFAVATMGSVVHFAEPPAADLRRLGVFADGGRDFKVCSPKSMIRRWRSTHSSGYLPAAVSRLTCDPEGPGQGDV